MLKCQVHSRFDLKKIEDCIVLHFALCQCLSCPFLLLSSVCVYVCVCVCVCMCTRIAKLRVCVLACVHAYVCVQSFVRVRARKHMNVDVCMYGKRRSLLTVPNYNMLHQLTYLHFTVSNSKSQGPINAHFLCRYTGKWRWGKCY